MSKHSDIVGGSSAKRVINCPGSVALTARMPNLSSSYANEGSLLHNAAARCLETTCEPEDCLGMTFEGIELTQGLIDNKLIPAFDLLAEYDPKIELEFMVETEVSFGDFLPGVFGSADVIGRMGDKAVVLDWKFGDGVMVDAEENYQGLFYAAAAMRTPVVALFGPSGEGHWGPWGQPREGVHHVVTRSAQFNCRPCGLDGCGGGKVSECLTSITPDEVWSAMVPLLCVSLASISPENH